MKMGKLETRLMIDSDLGTLGFDRTNLERETKEIEKINGAQRNPKRPTQVLLTQDIHWLPCPTYEQLVQSRFKFSRAGDPALHAPFP